MYKSSVNSLQKVDLTVRKCEKLNFFFYGAHVKFFEKNKCDM